MKRKEFKGNLIYYKRLPCSYYGNPAYFGIFENGSGEHLEGRTASNASCAYGFLNYPDKPRKIKYHITKKGNVIFDYICIIDDKKEAFSDVR